MAELAFNPSVKAIVGARVEGYNQFYTGENQTGDIKLDNEQVVMTLIYSLQLTSLDRSRKQKLKSIIL